MNEEEIKELLRYWSGFFPADTAWSFNALVPVKITNQPPLSWEHTLPIDTSNPEGWGDFVAVAAESGLDLTGR